MASIAPVPAIPLAAPPLKVLSRREIFCGDIIITDVGWHTSHCVICIQSGSAEGGGVVAHAMGNTRVEVNFDKFGDKAGTIYRPHPALSDADQRSLTKTSFRLRDKVIYGSSSYPSLGLGSTDLTPEAEQWYNDFRTVHTTVPPAFEFGAYKPPPEPPIKMVCSQFVVALVQVALPRNHVSFIELDSRSTMPKNLRKYLVMHPRWRTVGRYVRAELGDR